MDDKYNKLIEFIKSCEPHTALTQSDISRLSGISKPTVGKYLPLMLARNELTELVVAQKSSGRIILVRK